MINPGVPGDECFFIKANAAVNLAQYSVLLGLLTEGSIIPYTNFHLWLGDVYVEENTQILIFTGKGQRRYTKTMDGHPMIVMFWGLDKTIFNDGNHLPVLVQIGSISLPPKHPLQLAKPQ